jgi:hypothetical protein
MTLPCQTRPRLAASERAPNGRPRGHWRVMTRMLATAALPLCLACGASQGADTPVSANVANLFVGELKIVEGKVVQADRDGNIVTLRFGTGQHDFVASLVIPLLNNFPPDPERAYLGKTVRVAGIIKEFRGVPQMIVRDASDIQVVGEAAPVAVSATAPGAPEAPLQREIEVLNERLRQMDERLRALEHTQPAGAGGQSE